MKLADRLPPSELVDTVLAESAYAYEMRGRRLEQARENVKKVRSLIRRVESRGYATIGRIAEYFETLRAGDESHAILEASGCVNLMTMHAAKGLEFPIVFLVNLQAPGRGRGGGFSIIERGPQGEPEVAFASNDATKLEDERDAEELRRLLYVGVTRARDRLYLAGQVDGRGELRRSGRSLASLLPSSIGGLFRDAAADQTRTQVTWTVPGASFAFGVCRPAKVMAETIVNAGPDRARGRHRAASAGRTPASPGGWNGAWCCCRRWRRKNVARRGSDAWTATDRHDCASAVSASSRSRHGPGTGAVVALGVDPLRRQAGHCRLGRRLRFRVRALSAPPRPSGPPGAAHLRGLACSRSRFRTSSRDAPVKLCEASSTAS